MQSDKNVENTPFAEWFKLNRVSGREFVKGRSVLVVGRDAGIVRIQTMCVNSVDDSLVPVSTSQLSHG